MAKKDAGNILGIVLLALAIVGAINWGLIGFFNFNLVDAIFGGGAKEITTPWARVVYALVGVAGLWAIFFLPRLRNAPHGTYSESRA